MVFEQHEIEDAVLSHFTTIFAGKRVPVYDVVVQDQVELTIMELEQILAKEGPMFKEDQFESQVCPPYSFTELEQILRDLPDGKAAGIDNISNELLKHSSFESKLYLQTFLNKIIQDGEVPSELNQGKCMLIFKVNKYAKKKTSWGLAVPSSDQLKQATY